MFRELAPLHFGGDIGARDATVGEIESGFTSTCLGHADTEHVLQVRVVQAVEWLKGG